MSKKGEWNRSAPPILRLLPLLGPALVFHVTLPVSAADLRISLADPLLPVAAVALLFFMLRRRIHITATGAKQLALVALLTAFLTLALIVGRIEVGSWTTWALLNKYVGWFVLVGFWAAGVATAVVAGSAGITFAVRGFLFGLAAVAVLDVGTILLNAANVPVPLLGDSIEASGFAENGNAFALMLLLGIALLLASRESSVLGIPEPASVFVLAILLVGLWLSGSVAGVLALIAVIAAAALKRHMAWRRLVKASGLALLLALVPPAIGTHAPLLGLDGGSRYGSGVRGAMSGDVAVTDSSTAERFQLTRDALDMWLEYPVVGAGLGHFLHQQSRRHPENPQVVHSTPLWLLTEMGVLGLAVFGAIFLLLMRAFWRGAAGAGSDAWFVGSAFVFLAGFAVMSLFHELMYQRLAWYIAGLALGVIRPGLALAGSMTGKSASPGAAFRDVADPEVSSSR